MANFSPTATGTVLNALGFAGCEPTRVFAQEYEAPPRMCRRGHRMVRRINCKIVVTGTLTLLLLNRVEQERTARASGQEREIGE